MSARCALVAPTKNKESDWRTSSSAEGCRFGGSHLYPREAAERVCPTTATYGNSSPFAAWHVITRTASLAAGGGIRLGAPAFNESRKYSPKLSRDWRRGESRRPIRHLAACESAVVISPSSSERSAPAGRARILRR